MEIHRLARYSESLDKWIPEFRATREVTKGQVEESTVILRVTLNMKDNQVHTFTAYQLVSGGYVFLVENRDGYDPYQVASFVIKAETDWDAVRAAQAEQVLAEAEERREEAAKSAERARLRRNCRLLYQRTKDKKVSDLTVSETKLVNACDALGYYAP